MNNLQIFNNAEFGSIRTVVIDDEPWFVGKDIAEYFGDSNYRKKGKIQHEFKMYFDILN